MGLDPASDKGQKKALEVVEFKIYKQQLDTIVENLVAVIKQCVKKVDECLSKVDDNVAAVVHRDVSERDSQLNLLFSQVEVGNFSCLQYLFILTCKINC